MAKSNLGTYLILGAGAWVFGDIALKGGFGSATQSAVADFVNKLGIHASVGINPAGSGASTGTTATAGSGASTGTTRGTCNTAFIPGVNYVENRNGTFNVVLHGQVVYSSPDQSAAEAYYNAHVCAY